MNAPNLILRSRVSGVSKDGPQTRCSFPPFETHKPLSPLSRRNGDCAMLLRVRWFSA